MFIHKTVIHKRQSFIRNIHSNMGLFGLRFAICKPLGQGKQTIFSLPSTLPVPCFNHSYILPERTKRNCDSHWTQRVIISCLIPLMRNPFYVCSFLWVSYRFFVISSLSTISVSSRQTKLLLQLYANKHGEVAFDRKKGFDESVNHWLRIPLSRLSRNIQQFNCKTRWLEQ